MLMPFQYFLYCLAKKNVNTIQGNIPITKHILNLITNVLASVLTLHFSAIQNTMFELNIFIQPVRG